MTALLTTTVEIRTVSETNQREHYMVRHRRRKAQRRSTFLGMLAAGRKANVDVPSGAPLLVRMTRVAPRGLDTDNLGSSLKAIRDGVADWLGRDDGDPLVLWEYEQRRGKPREYAVLIELFDRAEVEQ